MKQLASLFLALLTVTATAQINYPFNPDENADAFISTPDLMEFLVVFGYEWEQEEIQVDSIPLSMYLSSLEAMIQASALPEGTMPGQFLQWDGESWNLVIPKDGCTLPEACNYDPTAHVLDEDKCLFQDECGVCDGPGAVYDCGCEDIPEGDCDCEGNVVDAEIRMATAARMRRTDTPLRRLTEEQRRFVEQCSEVKRVNLASSRRSVRRSGHREWLEVKSDDPIVKIYHRRGREVVPTRKAEVVLDCSAEEAVVYCFNRGSREMKQRYKEGVHQWLSMAKETTTKRPTAAESLVKATVTVLDNVNVQAQFMRASMEAAKRLGAHKLTYLS